MFANIFRTSIRKGVSVLSNTVISNVFKRTKMDLAGKSIIITGGTTGIGLEVVNVLLTKKISNLAILDINEDVECIKQAAEKYPDVNVVYCKTDVSDKDEFTKNVQTMVEDKFGGCLDVMINNAGVINDSNPEYTVKVNLLGVMTGTLAAMCYMDKTKGGKGGLIANVASVLGLEPCAPLVVYTSTKHGVIGWTRSMAEPEIYEKTCVSHIALCPGVTETPLVNELEGNLLFPYTLEKATEFLSERQTAHECACQMVKAIEENTNGSIWIIDYGKLNRVKPTKYWSLKH